MQQQQSDFLAREGNGSPLGDAPLLQPAESKHAVPLMQQRFTVSFQHPGLVHRVDNRGAKRGDDDEGDDMSANDLDDDDDAAWVNNIILKLRPLEDEFEGAVDSIEKKAVDFEAALRAHREAEDADVVAAETGDVITEDDLPLYFANSRRQLIRRDPQFNLLRRWFLEAKVDRARRLVPKPRPPSDPPTQEEAGLHLSREDKASTPLNASTTAAAEALEAKLQEQAVGATGHCFGAHVLEGTPATDAGREEALTVVLDLAQRVKSARNLHELKLLGFPMSSCETHVLMTRVIAAKPAPGAITRLVLRHCQLATPALVPIVRFLEAGRAALTSLDLSHNLLDEVGCKVLERGLARSPITTLSVRNNRIQTGTYSTAVLMLMLNNNVTDIDVGFTGLSDNSVVKLCTVLRTNSTKLRHLNLDGAEMTPRVVLLLLDTVAEGGRLVRLGVDHVYNCSTAQFHQRLDSILQRNADHAKRMRQIAAGGIGGGGGDTATTSTPPRVPPGLDASNHSETVSTATAEAGKPHLESPSHNRGQHNLQSLRVVPPLHRVS